MSLRHAFSNLVADGTNTSVVRPSDWNSAHVQAMTLAGNTAGQSSFSATNVILQGGNNITLSAITAAGVATVLMSGAAQSADVNKAGTGFTTTTVAGAVVAGTNDTNGLKLAVPAYLTTAAQSDHTHSQYINTSQSSLFQHTSATSAITSNAAHSTHTHGAVAFSGTNVSASFTSQSNGLSIQLSAPAPGGGAGDGYNILGVNGGATQLSTTYQLSNANNVSFGLNAGTITASASYPAQTVDTNKAGTGFSSTTVAGTAVVGTLNTNGLSLGVPAFLTTYVNDLTSGRAGTGFTSTTTAGAAPAATLNTNGLSFAMPAYLTTAALSQTTSAFVQTAQSSLFQHTSATSAITSNAFPSADTTKFAGTGTTFNGTNVSGSMTLNSNGLRLDLSGQGGGVINQTGPNIAAGTQTATSGTVVFSNSNGVSFGLNGQTLTASVAAAGGVTNTMWFPFNEAVNVMGQQGQGTLHLVPVPTPDIGAATVSFDRLCFPILHSHATNSTGSVTLSMWFGLYTRNNSTISLEHSTSFTTGYTFSGTANSSVLSGMRLLTVPWTSSVAGNRYVVGVLSRTTTGGANCTVSQVLVSNLNTNFSGIFGAATTASAQWPLGWGQYSATTSALPASIAYSQIYGTNSNGMRNPEWFLVNGTA